MNNNDKLAAADLMTLENYAKQRADFRGEVMAHKKNRRVAVGPNATLYFEDRLTMQYQVQEILRIEKIFEPTEIAAELAAYNPLIPDGSNWKATFMLEFEDETVRRAALGRLIGIERALWIRVGDHPDVAPIANEDLTRETADKTSAVHFLRFELTAAMVAAAKGGAAIAIGARHPEYTHTTTLSAEVAAALVGDLRGVH